MVPFSLDFCGVQRGIQQGLGAPFQNKCLVEEFFGMIRRNFIHPEGNC